MTTKAYPLHWPAGFPRSKSTESHPRFEKTLAQALKFLMGEVDRMGGKKLILSSNVTLGSENPGDKGVCAYFELEGQTFAIPCDRWNRVEHNVYAIGLTIEAMRGMERWGAKHMIKAMFSGFLALEHRTTAAWYEVLGLSPSGPWTEKQIIDAWRIKAYDSHPDRPGGSESKMLELNQAKDIGLATVKGR